MTRRPAAQMPESLRHFMRAGQHPARAFECPWPGCLAAAHKPCVRPSDRRLLPKVHQQRMAAWARTVACCPTCQVTPTVPCHTDGRALEDGAVHARRYEEAEATAA